MNGCSGTSDRDERTAATAYPLYVFVSEGSFVEPSADPAAMYRLACRECGEAFEEGETSVPSRSIRGNPLVHEECSDV